MSERRKARGRCVGGGEVVYTPCYECGGECRGHPLDVTPAPAGAPPADVTEYSAMLDATARPAPAGETTPEQMIRRALHADTRLTDADYNRCVELLASRASSDEVAKWKSAAEDELRRRRALGEEVARLRAALERIATTNIFAVDGSSRALVEIARRALSPAPETRP